MSVELTIPEVRRTLEPPSQYLLWIDGVGGFLVCLSHRVTLGQANPESAVDIPLLADVSRHHATIQRDPEGCFLEARNDWHNAPLAFGRDLLCAWR